MRLLPAVTAVTSLVLLAACTPVGVPPLSAPAAVGPVDPGAPPANPAALPPGADSPPVASAPASSAVASPTASVAGEPGDGSTAGQDKRLIYVQGAEARGELVTRTPFLVQNAEYIDSLPFDGVAVDIPATYGLMQGEPMSYDDIYTSWLAPLKGRFVNVTDNVVRVNIDDPGDVYDDQAWLITVQNWRNLARAIKDAGLKGIMFDNEEYGNPWLNFPEDYVDTGGRSVSDYQAQTQLRGRQIGEAISAEFPGIRLSVMHGPYASEPATPTPVRARQIGDADAYELLGPLFVGFVQGMPAGSSVIDGGELYALRSTADFSVSYDWRKNGMPSEATNSSFIPADLRSQWQSRVSISFGVFNRPFPDDLTMTPAIMRPTLANALRQADEEVWYYAESDAYIAPGRVSEDWLQAIRDARQDAVAGS